MIPAALAATLVHVHASWRGQLAVLGFGSVLLATVLHDASSGGDLLLRFVVALMFVALLLAGSVRAAAAAAAQASVSVEAELLALGRLVPRLIVQCGALVLPVSLAGFVTLQLASVAPLVSLVLIPITGLVALLLAAPILLAIAAVAQGDRGWLPLVAITAARRSPAQLMILVLVGAVLAGTAALPLMLIGLVFAAVAGPLGALGFGIAAASMIPWIGCGMLAAWNALGASVEVDSNAPGIGDVRRGATPLTEASFGMPQSEAMQEAAAWDVAVDAGAVWGTWIQLATGVSANLVVTWSGAMPPELGIAGADGVWRSMIQLSVPGALVAIDLPAGASYLQVGVRAPHAQSISLRLLVPATLAA